MRTLKTWAAAAAMVALTGAAQAALVNLGDGTVKDTNTNLIWLQNWNVNGVKNWSTQRNWALDLNFANSSDWRLPEISEYAALFSSYGNPTSSSLPFTNVQTVFYWSGTENALDPRFSLAFRTFDGLERSSVKTFGLFAVAVRPGDVTASVPEPQTLALALLALGATVVARRRRPR